MPRSKKIRVWCAFPEVLAALNNAVLALMDSLGVEAIPSVV